MTSIGVLQIVVFFGLILLCTKPIGLFMSRLFQGQRTFLHPVLRPDRGAGLQGLRRPRETKNRSGPRYALSVLMFSLFAFLFPYALMRLQGLLPLNPQGFGAAQVSPDQAFNTAVSFMTNTNWQWYSGESTMSYLVQMAGARGPELRLGSGRHRGRDRADPRLRPSRDRQDRQLLGRPDARHALRPDSAVDRRGARAGARRASFRISIPTPSPRRVEGATQTIAQGPVASQEAIKQLGTNGGGFFNANSSHPFESPNGFTNLVQILLIFVLGAGLTYTFGHMVKDTRQGWALFWAMAVMFLIGVFVAYPAEQAGNPILAKAGLERAATDTQSGGNMEGKETRFGIAGSALFATVTTDASCGAVNSDARQLHAARRTGAAVQHADRRGDLRRRRRGSLRHAALRDRRRVHRRPDGRPHAGVHRQEDSAEGSEDGVLRHSRHLVPDSRRSPASAS